MSNIQDDIRDLIVGCTDADTNDANFAAGRILAIPEIAEALETSENLRANQEKQRRMLGHSIKVR